MTYRKLKKRLNREFGVIPDIPYFAGDIDTIRAYYDYRRSAEPGEFMLDDITWNDLHMDDIFQRINPGLSTSGEQYLYYMLRHPAVRSGDFEDRKALISFIENNPMLRLNMQVILSKLGRARSADLCEAFHPATRGPGWLILYLSLFATLLLSALALQFTPYALAFVFVLTIFNSVFHDFRLAKVSRDFNTVNYSVSMLFALRRLQKLGNTALDSKLTAAYHSLVRLRWVMRTGGASVIAGDPIGELVCSLSLIDLITYEFIKNRLGRLHRDIFTVHEHLGKIDAAIAAASFRKSFTGYSVPDIDFGENKPAFIEISGMIHPMLRNPVPNDLHTNRPLLITGSNASGKSTFLKTTAVCAVMAQSLCTAPASGYRASAFRIFTSMALSDDLMSGDSYYISEIKSIKRVMDAVKNGIPVLCLIDEVLRGTNTVERIAASSEILESLFEKGALCIAATHDIELCTMLGGRYDLYHFEETVDEREMNFDYIIRKGPAMSRNAIRLLKLMGFSERFVEAAEKKATTYLETGMWNRTGPEVTP